MKTCASFFAFVLIGFSTVAFAKTPVNLEVYGLGIISGQTNGALLETGRQYRLAAKPGRDQIFLNWQDNAQIISYDSALKFQMQDGLVLKATFGPNPYPNSAGIYQGLLSNKKHIFNGGILGEIQQPVDGYAALDLTLSKSGTFSGKLYLEFLTYSFSGKLHWQTGTNATATVRLATSDPNLAWFSQSGINLDLIFDPADRQFTGLVTEWNVLTMWNQATVYRSDASVQICRANSSQPPLGLYNFCVPPSTNQEAPAGYSFGSGKVSSRGTIAGVLNLADQLKPISFQAPLTENGQFRLFARSSDKKSLLMGWVAFTNQSGLDLKGENLTWLKLPGASAFYTNGYKVSCELFGSHYSPIDFNGLNSDSNSILLADGNLSEEITNSLTLAQNHFSFPTGNLHQIKLTAKTTTGIISGTMRPGNSVRPVPFRAIFLPAANAAYGFFLGTNQSGFVFLGEPN